MGLVTTKEMFEKAYNGGYAIGAFNVNNMEIVQGIMEAATKIMHQLFCKYQLEQENMLILFI